MRVGVAVVVHSWERRGGSRNGGVVVYIGGHQDMFVKISQTRTGREGLWWGKVQNEGI